MTGVIKTLRESYGFIVPEVGDDHFFHASDVVGAIAFAELKVGDRVEFDAVAPTPTKGSRALSVRFAG